MRLLTSFRTYLFAMISTAQIGIEFALSASTQVLRPVVDFGLRYTLAALDYLTPMWINHAMIDRTRCSVKHIFTSIHRMAVPKNQRAGHDSAASFATHGDRSIPMLC